MSTNSFKCDPCRNLILPIVGLKSASRRNEFLLNLLFSILISLGLYSKNECFKLFQVYDRNHSMGGDDIPF